MFVIVKLGKLCISHHMHYTIYYYQEMCIRKICLGCLWSSLRQHCIKNRRDSLLKNHSTGSGILPEIIVWKHSLPPSAGQALWCKEEARCELYNHLCQCVKLLCRQMNRNLKFFLEYMDATTSRLKRRGGICSKACSADGIEVHWCLWNWQLTQLECASVLP